MLTSTTTQPVTFTATIRSGQTVYWAKLPTLADAAAVAALFPKSLLVKASRYTNSDLEDVGSVQITINTKANKTTGEVNEAGQRRLAGFMRTATKLGYVVEG